MTQDTTKSLDCGQSSLTGELERALREDRFVRVFDGRWSGGFVDMAEIETAIAGGTVLIETHGGMEFVVRSNV